MAANCNGKSSKTQYTYVSKIELNFVQFRMSNPTHDANILKSLFFNHSALYSHGSLYPKRILHRLTIWRVFQLFFVPTMVMVLNVCYFPLQKLLHLFGRTKSDIVNVATNVAISHVLYTKS